MLGHVVCVRVRHEPGDKGRCHGGQDQSPRARKSRACNARECRLIIAGARLADGSDRVDVSGDEEEYGDGAAAAHGQAEEGQLEQMRCGFGIAGGRVQPGHESGAQMAAHDHEGGNAAQALEVTVLAAVTRAGGQS